LIYHIVR